MRSVHFADALLTRNWARTYQRYHPGVTTMWLAGIGLKLFAWQQGLTSLQLLSIEPTKPSTLDSAVAAGVLPIAFVVSLCIALSYFLLCNITEQRIAFSGSFLLALDPFYTTYSKEIHVNALLATFMLMSCLFLLNYVYRGRRIWLILSGIFAGLAFLTKAPALFLVPYVALAVVADRLGRSGLAARRWDRQPWVPAHLVRLLRELLMWGGAAAVVFVVLWPAMWVEPIGVLRKMAERVLYHVETPHFSPVFFNGRATFEDPGLRFYLATIAWKTTCVTLPMACAAMVFALLWFRRNKYRKLVWLLVVYVVFFTIQMGLGGRKEVSYLLPVFPALDILAALGLAQGAKALGRIRLWQRLPTAFVLLALALQAGVVIPRHPYYGTHHNYLLGGSQVAQHILPLQDQGEGLDLAAQYLNMQPRAQRSVAEIESRSALTFERKFVGLTSTTSDPRATYRVYYVNQVMRQLGDEEWREAWKADRQTTPLWSVAFDRVPYVWVYGAPPEEPAAGGPATKVDYQLGEHIRLTGTRFSAESLMPGDTLTLVLIWESDGEVVENYTVFCHVLSASGELVAQRDGRPIYGVRPTPSWRAGEVIEDSCEIVLGTDLAPGQYEVSVGMYDLESMARLPATNANGERLRHDRIVLGSLRVKAPRSGGGAD